jgi:branched-chain amino acid transport system permease protein
MDILQAIASGIAFGVLYGLIGLGFSIMYRTTGILNFAQGDLVVLGGYVVVRLDQHGWPLGLALLVAGLAVGVFMALIERIVLQRVYGYGLAYPIVVTVGLALAIESGIQLVEGATPEFPPLLTADAPIDIGGVHVTHQQIAVVIVAVVLAALAIGFVEWTRVGRALRAVAVDRHVAGLLGIPAKWYFTLAFLVGGGIAGVTGGLLGDAYTLTPTLGLSLSLAGFTAAIIGGLGNGYGAMLGGILVGVLENLAVLYISPGYKEGVALGALILFLLVRPDGLLGEPAAHGRAV